MPVSTRAFGATLSPSVETAWAKEIAAACDPFSAFLLPSRIELHLEKDGPTGIIKTSADPWNDRVTIRDDEIFGQGLYDPTEDLAMKLTHEIGHLFWHQNRSPFIERACAAWRRRNPPPPAVEIEALEARLTSVLGTLERVPEDERAGSGAWREKHDLEKKLDRISGKWIDRPHALGGFEDAATAYNELFADLGWVMRSGSGTIATGALGHGRNFTDPVNLGRWSETEPHRALFPTRRFLWKWYLSVPQNRDRKTELLRAIHESLGEAAVDHLIASWDLSRPTAQEMNRALIRILLKNLKSFRRPSPAYGVRARAATTRRTETVRAPLTRSLLARSPDAKPVVEAFGGLKAFEALKSKRTFGGELPPFEPFVPLIDLPGAIEGARLYAKARGARALHEAASAVWSLNDASLSNGLRRVRAPSFRALVDRAGFDAAAQAVTGARGLDDFESRYRSLGDFIALHGNDPEVFIRLVAERGPDQAVEMVRAGAASYREERTRVSDLTKAPDPRTKAEWAIRKLQLTCHLPLGEVADRWVAALDGHGAAIDLIPWMGPRALSVLEAVGVPTANAALVGAGSTEALFARRKLLLAEARTPERAERLRAAFAAHGGASFERAFAALAEHDRRFALDPMLPPASLLIEHLGVVEAGRITDLFAEDPDGARRFAASSRGGWLELIDALGAAKSDVLRRRFAAARAPADWNPAAQYVARDGVFDLARFGTIEKEGFPSSPIFGASMFRAVKEGVARIQLGQIRSALDLWNHVRAWRADVAGQLGQIGDPMYGGRIFNGPLPYWDHTTGTHIRGRYAHMGPRVRDLFPEPVPIDRFTAESSHLGRWIAEDPVRGGIRVYQGQIFGEHAGERIPLTRLVWVDGDAPTPTSTIWHSSKESVERASTHVEALFAQARAPVCTEGELLDLAPRLEWWLCQMCPDKSGSASQADAFVRTLLASRGIVLAPWRRGVVPDLEALFSREDDFVRAWPGFLERAPGPA
jgi:avirulence protein AvrB/AvrC